MSTRTLAALCVVVAVAAGALIYFGGKPAENSITLDFGSTNAASSTSGAAMSTEPRVVPTGMLEYRSTAYHFSLFYPNTLSAELHKEDGGAATFTFQNVSTAEGFQLYVTPYSETKMSNTRFTQDEPSGVRKDLTTITVDGATAAAFYSTDALLGETREIWFIRGGYLYELTTLKSLDTWLDGIVRTWKFI